MRTVKLFGNDFSGREKVGLVVLGAVSYAPVTRPYICQRTPTYGDTSDNLGARFI